MPPPARPHARSLLLLLLLPALLSACAGRRPEPGGASTLTVALAPAFGASQSGRVLVFARRVVPGEPADAPVDAALFRPNGTAIAAIEVDDFGPDAPARLDPESPDNFPGPFSTLAPGTYRFQAVLDRLHRYNYAGREAGDLTSPVVQARWPGPVPPLVIDRTVKAEDPKAWLARLRPERRAALERALASLQPIDLASPVLTAFHGRPVAIRGWIALPPGYGAGETRYPVVYTDGGFGSNLESARRSAAAEAVRMARGRTPPMIWVFLDHATTHGTHEFADSANNGPWGTALTTELLPWIDGRLRTDARAAGRYTTGHSSGGWSALWLQVRYPRLFGGSWPTAPDSADFRDFGNVDLYAPGADLYLDAGGQPVPAMRENGEVVADQQESVRLEEVLGGSGGQYASFEWVFSPRGPDGRPVPLFDRATGRVDPAVASYWREHYDIAARLARDWPAIGADLVGKIHLTVGTEDSFYLDRPARRLEALLDRLGAGATFRYLVGRNHFDLYARDDDPEWLDREIAREIHAAWTAASPATFP